MICVTQTQVLARGEDTSLGRRLKANSGGVPKGDGSCPKALYFYQSFAFEALFSLYDIKPSQRCLCSSGKDGSFFMILESGETVGSSYGLELSQNIRILPEVSYLPFPQL